MESASERRVTTLFDEEEELNDQVKPLQPVPENIFNPQYMENMLISPTVTRMFKDRGLTFEGMDLKTPKPTTQPQVKKQNSSKPAAMIPGQGVATQSELLNELKKAESQGNNQLVASLLETMLSKDLNPGEKGEFQTQKCNLMFKMGRYSESQDAALSLLSRVQELSDEALLNVLLVLSKCRLELGAVDSGYADLLRAQGILWDWQAKKVMEGKYEELKDERDVELWKDTAQDKDISSLEELKLLYQLRYSKETNATYTCCVTGGNIQSYLLGLDDKDSFGLKDKSQFKILPEFRNRRVLAVACGEHHTLALVEGDTFSLYSPQDIKSKEKVTFGTPDLFGWGENSCGQITGFETQENIKKPTVIRHFMGKDLQGINANRANSIAYDRQGNVYEWGYRANGNVSVEVTFSEKKGIQDVKLGNQFSSILTKDNQLYISGVFVGLSDEIQGYQEIKKEIQLKQIECGNSHLIGLTHKGEVFVIGTNNLGQLGVGDSTSKSASFIKADVPSYVSTPTRVFAFKDISSFVSSDQELYMWGAIHDAKSNAKIYWKPFQFELDDENGVNRVGGSGNQLFVLDSKGQPYIWDMGTSSKFKRYSTTDNECFGEIATGKGFQVLMKAYVEPSLCCLEPDDTQTLETFNPITFRIKLMDRSGSHHYNSSYPLRYFVYFAQTAPNLPELEDKMMSETLSAFRDRKSNAPMINVIGEGDCPVQDVSVKAGGDNKSIQELQFTLQKDGMYYMYVFLNEKPIRDLPLIFNIGKSSRQDELQEKAEEKWRREQELKKAKEEAELRKKLEAQRENEEREKRLQETEKRAQEALKEHLQQQKETQQKLEEERKTRKEAAVGGGFDLSKVKTTKPSPLDVRNEVKSPTQLPNINRGNSKGPTSKMSISTTTPKVTTPTIRSNTSTSTSKTTGLRGATPTSTMSKTGTLPPKTTKSIPTTLATPKTDKIQPKVATTKAATPVSSGSITSSENFSSTGGMNSMNNTTTSTGRATPSEKKAVQVGNVYGKKPTGTGFPAKNTRK